MTKTFDLGSNLISGDFLFVYGREFLFIDAATPLTVKVIIIGSTIENVIT